ncbi:MAG: ATP phosphoribosyltransferase regulatory subunit [Gammaproteobacteria bacterium]|nr:ATP phosphoribosyltransferase regulatory subunit [Gammaproteobacteria bacterium]
MPTDERWLLPDGVEEILPDEAWRLEGIRRELTDLFYRNGYELVVPPLMEYLESLLTGVGKDLDLQTLKLIDQLTGRLMGVRADMTPQVARIDAHYLKRSSVVRLCYLGPVLFSRPLALGGSREPLQVGAELFGYAGPHGDCEILQLMVRALEIVGLERPHIDLGHVGVFRGLAREAGLSDDQEIELFDALQRKSTSDIEAALSGCAISSRARDMLLSLVEYNGDVSVISEARRGLTDAGPEVTAALDNVEEVANLVSQYLPEVSLYCDLAELRGYYYHTGVVFSAFVPGVGQAIARGGRYDNIGEPFGHARPATGFSADLRQLLRLANSKPEQPGLAIAAPFSEDPELRKQIQRLRRSGERVIPCLPGQAENDIKTACDRKLVNKNGKWVTTPL